LSGASDAKLYDLLSKGAIVKASGASTVNMQVSKLLKAQASGASNINYKGTAIVKEMNSSGASSIRHKD
jgi:membrane carboxypeptidase/penicillin-binding protein PbpC